MSELQQTPLFDRHQSLGARMAPFAGWNMPIQYEGILPEHHHTRNRASLFDTCHMGEFDVRGPRAEVDLERLLTLNVSGIKEGQCRYGFLLDDKGGVIDDLTCYRRGPDHFFLVVNAGTLGGDSDWIRSKLSEDTVFSDWSPRRTKLDVQGPDARELLEAASGQTLPKLGYFRFTDLELFGLPMTLSRTGYTGEWGYELYFDNEGAEAVWDALTASGNIKPAGLGARDTLRLEMGYALYGHELGRDQSPWGLARGGFIDLSKDFIGRAGVQAESEQPVRYLAGLALEGKRAAREGDAVYHGDRVVGTVSSGSLAPSLDHAVALAYLDCAVAEVDTELGIECRGKMLAGRVVPLPFYQAGSARRKDPRA